MRSTRLAIALALAFALMATACGGSDTTTSAAQASDSGPAGEGIVLPTTDGGQLAFNDLEGKPALLWFWAPW